MANEKLPALTEHQEFVCEEGCGSCEPIEFDYCYREQTQLSTGKKTKYYHKAYKSSCCGGRLAVYDNSTNDFIPV